MLASVFFTEFRMVGSSDKFNQLQWKHEFNKNRIFSYFKNILHTANFIGVATFVLLQKLN